MRRGVLLGLVLAGPLAAQRPCASIPIHYPCELVFEMPPAAVEEHPNPYLTVQLHAEFRSPRHRTLAIPGFWYGGNRLVVRFSPTETGEWNYRVTSNIVAFDGGTGKIAALDSDRPGFLRSDNVHHWSYTPARTPHLWMGDTSYRFAWLDRGVFERLIEARSSQKFNHMRGLVMHPDPGLPPAFLTPDQPNIAHFRELDYRVLLLNRKGIFADLILAGDQNHLVRVFPTAGQRERYIRYLVARYGSMMITWQGVQEFEEYTGARALLKEIGLALRRLDPYGHPRTTHTVASSAPLASDGWMDHVLYQSSDIALGAIERQLLGMPPVNAGFGYENSGAGASHPQHVDSETFRKRLWNAVMNGQYPYFGNTGSCGESFPVEDAYFDSPGARAMTAWYDLFQRTRYWELQPFFEVDGARGLALGGIEYILYAEKPGLIEAVTEKQTYQVYWMRPSTGEIIKDRKDHKEERFSRSTPDNRSDWVVHLSRDGRKESMLRTWKFESRPVFRQEIERNPQRVPFEIVEPSAATLPAGEPIEFSVRVTRETRATGSMLYLWTAEATASGQGYRIIGSGASGQLRIPVSLANDYPAVTNLRLYGMNLNGKIYAIDRVVRLTR